jgi:cobalamin biosynthesis Co2+ chelatase CbiK
LQERSVTFGHHICEEVETLSQNFGSVYLAATKLGKLQKQTYERFLKNVMHPYPHIKKDKFLLIIDFWGGQMNPAI